ncbi:hypothetical protein F5Y04DRAFT_188190 [Hypomontagnella monticulosa]|nr:hypothetical protein F5Y04DRAFT_188190 [Hypomontagnella monticulosa]
MTKVALPLSWKHTIVREILSCPTMPDGKSEGNYASMRTSWVLMHQPVKRKTNASDLFVQLGDILEGKYAGDQEKGRIVEIYLSAILHRNILLRKYNSQRLLVRLL